MRKNDYGKYKKNWSRTFASAIAIIVDVVQST